MNVSRNVIRSSNKRHEGLVASADVISENLSTSFEVSLFVSCGKDLSWLRRNNKKDNIMYIKHQPASVSSVFPFTPPANYSLMSVTERDERVFEAAAPALTGITAGGLRALPSHFSGGPILNFTRRDQFRGNDDAA